MAGLGEFRLRGVNGRAGGMAGRAGVSFGRNSPVGIAGVAGIDTSQARQLDRKDRPSAGRIGKADRAAQSLNICFTMLKPSPVPVFLRGIGSIGLSEFPEDCEL